jgi:hypothetical protein
MHAVVVAEQTTAVNFPLTSKALVTGSAYFDLDGSKTFDPPNDISWADGFAYADLNNDGMRQENEPAAETNPSNQFAIGYALALDAGTYHIRFDKQGPWPLVGPAEYVITLTAAEVRNNVDFEVVQS